MGGSSSTTNSNQKIVNETILSAVTNVCQRYSELISQDASVQQNLTIDMSGVTCESLDIDQSLTANLKVMKSLDQQSAATFKNDLIAQVMNDLKQSAQTSQEMGAILNNAATTTNQDIFNEISVTMQNNLMIESLISTCQKYSGKQELTIKLSQVNVKGSCRIDQSALVEMAASSITKSMMNSLSDNKSTAALTTDATTTAKTEQTGLNAMLKTVTDFLSNIFSGWILMAIVALIIGLIIVIMFGDKGLALVKSKYKL